MLAMYTFMLAKNGWYFWVTPTTPPKYSWTKIKTPTYIIDFQKHGKKSQHSFSDENSFSFPPKTVSLLLSHFCHFGKARKISINIKRTEENWKWKMRICFSFYFLFLRFGLQRGKKIKISTLKGKWKNSFHFFLNNLLQGLFILLFFVFMLCCCVFPYHARDGNSFFNLHKKT